MIRFPCTVCKKVFKAPAEWGGRKCKCSRCGQALTIPGVPPKPSGCAAATPKTFPCPKCHTALRACEELVGAVTTCPRCGTRFAVPGPAVPALRLVEQPCPEEPDEELAEVLPAEVPSVLAAPELLPNCPAGLDVPEPPRSPWRFLIPVAVIAVVLGVVFGFGGLI